MVQGIYNERFEHLIYDSLSQEILGGNVGPGEMVEFKREGEKLRLDVVKATEDFHNFDRPR